MVELSVGQDDTLDRYMAIAIGCVAVELLYLVPDVGRCIEEEPVRAIGTYRDG